MKITISDIVIEFSFLFLLSFMVVILPVMIILINSYFKKYMDSK